LNRNSKREILNFFRSYFLLSAVSFSVLVSSQKTRREQKKDAAVIRARALC
jgi:hypothetical protein